MEYRLKRKNATRHLIFLFIIIIFALLQITVLDYIDIFNVKPDLLFICVVYASIFFESRYAISLSVFAGILKDTLSVNIFGINTLIFALSSFLIIKLSKKISLDNNLIRMGLVSVLILINDAIVRLAFLFLGNLTSWGMFLRVAFIESLYTASILPFVFRIIKPALYS